MGLLFARNAKENLGFRLRFKTKVCRQEPHQETDILVFRHKHAKRLILYVAFNVFHLTGVLVIILNKNMTLQY